MKKILFTTIAFILMIDYAYSQTTDLDQFNHNRNQINKYAMMTLGSWAVGNMAVNGALYRSGEKDRKYFYQMNIAWNAINLAIAGFGLYGALNPDTTLTLFESIKQQGNIEKILLFNAGLDVGYIMTGFYLKERAKNLLQHHDRLKGYGNSLVLQGGFLFLFDLTVYFIQAGNHDLMKKLLDHVTLAPGSIGLTLHF
ncbi:hypothetical protein L0Z72_16290 [candidate division KSB1 bacterium]|nr:hypothetical protein [candidate division KSB1 bacterium]